MFACAYWWFAFFVFSLSSKNNINGSNVHNKFPSNTLSHDSPVYNFSPIRRIKASTFTTMASVNNCLANWELSFCFGFSMLNSPYRLLLSLLKHLKEPCNRHFCHCFALLKSWFAWFRRNSGFYNSSNVFRIKCELAGVARLRTYSCFEALKVRDFGSNRCNVTAIIKKSAWFLRNQPYKKQQTRLICCLFSKIFYALDGLDNKNR